MVVALKTNWSVRYVGHVFFFHMANISKIMVTLLNMVKWPLWLVRFTSVVGPPLRYASESYESLHEI